MSHRKVILLKHILMQKLENYHENVPELQDRRPVNIK